MERGRLEDTLQRKLQDFGPAGDVPSWGEMQRRMVLHANANPPARPLRRPGFWLRSGAAAAVLLAAVLGLWFGTRPGQIASDPALADILPPPAVSATQSEPKSDVPALDNPVLNRIFNSARKINVASASGGDVLPAASHAPAPAGNYNVAVAENPAGHVEAAPSQAGKSAPSSDGYAPDRATIEAYRRKFDEPETNRKHSRRQGEKWLASLYANASTFSSAAAGGASGVGPMMSMNAGLLDVSAMKSTPQIDRNLLDHRFPVSVGLSVRKYIAPRLGIETGLTYTYLRSTADVDRAFSYRYDQKLHYLGIPLSLTYSVLDSRRFDIYFSGGVMAEIPVSARGTTEIFTGPNLTSTVSEKIPTGGLLWSVNVGTGVGVKVVDHFGLYFEPGVNYYFKNKNQPDSYRTANPWNVNMRVGLRFSF